MTLVPRMNSTGRMPSAMFRMMDATVRPMPLFGSSRAISQRELTDMRMKAANWAKRDGFAVWAVWAVSKSVILGLRLRSKSNAKRRNWRIDIEGYVAGQTRGNSELPFLGERTFAVKRA